MFTHHFCWISFQWYQKLLPKKHMIQPWIPGFFWSNFADLHPSQVTLVSDSMPSWVLRLGTMMSGAWRRFFDPGFDFWLQGGYIRIHQNLAVLNRTQPKDKSRLPDKVETMVIYNEELKLGGGFILYVLNAYLGKMSTLACIFFRWGWWKNPPTRFI